MNHVEVQVDRLVGPTHHFGGLGVGNLASQSHAGQTSNPAAAALQGLDKMRLVAGYGLPQVVLPPQPRPAARFLRRFGFRGNVTEQLRQCRDTDPELLSALMSCSAMWTANAATATPQVDCQGSDAAGPAWLTVANLESSLHRAIEPRTTRADLRRALGDTCRIRCAVPGGVAMRDEGAANHMRLVAEHGGPGIHVFVYGDGDPLPTRHWPRQTRRAFAAIARAHRLASDDTFYFKQHPAAIDAGAFHNDVVAMSHQELLIHHQHAFCEDASQMMRLASRFQQLTRAPLQRLEVSEQELSLADAVQTYLFNSQIISPHGREDSRPILLCPEQVQQHPAARQIVRRWCSSGLFATSHFIPLDQSMSAGGGPACLRLRVPLPDELARSLPTCGRWSEKLDEALRRVIEQDYPTELKWSDLADPVTLEQVVAAQRKVEQVLGRE